MSSWSCRYEADGFCRKVDGAYCRPGMKGCILVGKVTFQDGVVPSPVWPEGHGRRGAEASGAADGGAPSGSPGVTGSSGLPDPPEGR